MVQCISYIPNGINECAIKVEEQALNRHEKLYHRNSMQPIMTVVDPGEVYVISTVPEIYKFDMQVVFLIYIGSAFDKC
jgi:ATP-dependent protease HslVU (ClpYQ) peptidase subunit